MEIPIEELMHQLYDKNTSAAFQALQELERISDNTGLLYPYTERFAAMIADEKYVMRVRGFRLFCKQAKWDVDYKLDENIDTALQILSDPKPTAVRQALAALQDVMQYKKDLRQTVIDAVKNINYLKYKETMHGLIENDIRVLVNMGVKADGNE